MLFEALAHAELSRMVFDIFGGARTHEKSGHYDVERESCRDMCGGWQREIGILMMFLPHLILANHFNEKRFSATLSAPLATRQNHLDFSGMFLIAAK
jgi:hypothetical protein